MCIRDREGMAWATLTKLRKAPVERAGEIYAERNPFTPGESSIEVEDLTSEQLEPVAKEFSKDSETWTRRPFSTRCQSRRPSKRAAQRTLASAQEVRVRSILLFRVCC